MKFALIPLAVSLASASPVWNNVAKRQASSVASAASSAIESATSALESATSAAVESASSVAVVTDSVTSTVSSMMSSMSAAPSASASATPEYAILYPCAPGTQLVYVEEQMTYPGVTVQQAEPYLAFENSTWYGVVNATGNEIGATRFVQFPGIPVAVQEVLVNRSVDATTNAIQQVFNGTMPLTLPGVTLASYSTVFQFYNNETVSGASTGKIFTNACVNPASVQSTLAQLFQAALAALGTSVASGAASSGMSSMASAAPSAASSVASAASSGVASVVPSASAVASEAASVLSSATDAVAAATSTATEVVASVTASA